MPTRTDLPNMTGTYSSFGENPESSVYILIYGRLTLVRRWQTHGELYAGLDIIGGNGTVVALGDEPCDVKAKSQVLAGIALSDRHHRAK